MKILIACEESQTVCIEMRRLGHEAFSCDLQECSGGHLEWHIQGDALPLLNGDCSFETTDGISHNLNGKWDMIIAHPPCTYISNAGACRLYPRKGQLDVARYNKGLEAKEFFLKFLNADCERIAVENPVHSRIFDMPLYTQEIQPYQFGHPYSKKTRLWLKGLPQLIPTELISNYTPFLPSGTGRKLGGVSYGAKSCAHESKARSKTFPGIARAMAEQWAGDLKRGDEMIKVENGTIECDGRPIDVIFEISLGLCGIISNLAESAQQSENEVAEDVLETVNSAVRCAIKGASINQKDNRP